MASARWRGVAISGLALALLALPSRARADDPVDRSSDDTPRPGLGPWRPRFTGGWLFDDPMRNLLRAQSESGRIAADRTSSVLEWSLVAAPFGLSLGESLAFDPRPLDALALLGVDAEAYAVTALTTFAFKSLVGRERPFATATHLGVYCQDDAHRDEAACRGDRNASFLSGHTSAAFTGAGLVCAQRAYLGPSQPLWDALGCGAAMAGAATTALLRITADRHYATDTIAGALLGVGAGFALPIALHFSDGAPLRVGGGAMTRLDTAQDPGTVLLGMGAGIAVGAVIPLGIALVQHLVHPRESASRSRRSRSF